MEELERLVVRCPACDVWLPWAGPYGWVRHLTAEHPRSSFSTAVKGGLVDAPAGGRMA